MQNTQVAAIDVKAVVALQASRLRHRTELVRIPVRARAMRPAGGTQCFDHEEHAHHHLMRIRRAQLVRRLRDPLFVFPAFAAWMQLLAGLV